MFTFWAGRINFGNLPRSQIDIQFQDTSIRIEPHHIFSGALCYYWRFNCTACAQHVIYITCHDGFEHGVLLRYSSPDKLYRRTCWPRDNNCTSHTFNSGLMWVFGLYQRRSCPSLVIEVESGTEDVCRSVEIDPVCITIHYPVRKSAPPDYMKSLCIRPLPVASLGD
jgi:hypothetical protein